MAGINNKFNIIFLTKILNCALI